MGQESRKSNASILLAEAKLKAENQEGRFTTDGIPLAGLT
jgi:hypothetical protein